jgi:hypothetical protein
LISWSSSWYWERFHGFSSIEVACYNASRREVVEGLMRPLTWKLGSTRRRVYLFALTRPTTFSLTTCPSLQLQWRNTSPVDRVQAPYRFEPVKVFCLSSISQISHLIFQMGEIYHLISPKNIATFNMVILIRTRNLSFCQLFEMYVSLPLYNLSEFNQTFQFASWLISTQSLNWLICMLYFPYRNWLTNISHIVNPIFRSGRFEDKKIFYRGKHKTYCLKSQVITNRQRLCQLVHLDFPGSYNDFRVYNENI